MILIADSGSTKTQWFLTDSVNKPIELITLGFNPVMLSTAEIVSGLEKTLIPQLGKKNKMVRQIFFYGAGCSSADMQEKIKNILLPFFPNCAEISVLSDLWAGIHAGCGKEAGISCILGTGSNACVYDGEKIIGQLPSLGYFLGDEGSGNHIGKELVKAYFYGDMLGDLRKKFKEKFGLEEHNFVKDLYSQSRPNRYLASFALFGADNRESKFIQKIVKNCFELFADVQIRKLQTAEYLPLYFVGSIAKGFENELTAVMESKNYKVADIQKSPFPKLLEYYK